MLLLQLFLFSWGDRGELGAGEGSSLRKGALSWEADEVSKKRVFWGLSRTLRDHLLLYGHRVLGSLCCCWFWSLVPRVGMVTFPDGLSHWGDQLLVSW